MLVEQLIGGMEQTAMPVDGIRREDARRDGKLHLPASISAGGAAALPRSDMGETIPEHAMGYARVIVDVALSGMVAHGNEESERLTG